MSIKRDKRRFGQLLLAGVLLGAICLAPLNNVLADTTFPQEFWGDITVNGAPAPAGAEIITKIDGVARGSLTTTEAGKYGGTGTFGTRLAVCGEQTEVGHTITFWLNGTQASQTAVYEPGESTELDLSVGHSYSHPLSASNAWISAALDYLRDAQNTDGSIGDLGTSAWVVMAIAAAGEDPDDWAAGSDSIIDYLKDNRTSLGDIATDWARSILAITAADQDPTNFGGFDYVAELKSYYDGDQIGSDSLLNDDFWGVLALISARESQSSDIITDAVAFIKDNQNTDHGWGLIAGGNSDGDNTAAAIMALIAAGESPGSTVIDNALDYLKTRQQSDGGFLSEGDTNSAVGSWAIGAIVAADQDPTGSAWTTENGHNPVGHLLSLQVADGSFNWNASQNSNPEWMTAYAIAALRGKPYPVAIFSGSSDDGNGGGGGSSDGSSSPGFTIVVDSVTSSGRFTEEVTAKSGDGKIKLTISEDTIGKQAGGQSLRTIRITDMNYHPAPPEDSNVIGLVYDIEPDGATFDPPISMTVKYNPALLPDGASEENLVVAFWDEDTDEWVECPGTVDTGSNTITAEVSHFTAFTTLSSTRPADFTASDLTIAPQEAEIGQTVTISVTISNRGDLAGSYKVTLEINDTAVETKTVAVAGGDSQSASFEIIKDTAGTYQVAIDNLSGSFVVGEEVSAVAPPLASPQSTNESATPAAPTPPPPPSDQDEPINLPIIGGIIGGLILLALLAFLVIRHFTY